MYPYIEQIISSEELSKLSDKTKAFFEELLRNVNKTFFDMLTFKLNVDFEEAVNRKID